MWSTGLRSISSRQFLKVFDYFYTRPHQVQHASTSAGQNILKNSSLIKDNHNSRIQAYESDENNQVSNKDEIINTMKFCIETIEELAEMRKLPPDSLYVRVVVDTGECSERLYQFEIFTCEEKPLGNGDVSFPVGESSVVIGYDGGKHRRFCHRNDTKWIL